MIDAMILAAGKGERLGSLCRDKPKVMLPLRRNHLILEHNIRYLKSWGVRRLVINTYKYPALIQDYVGRHRDFGLHIRFSKESRLMGTAGAVKKAQRHFRSNPFIVLYGDNILDFDLAQMLRQHRKLKSFITMAVYKPQSTLHSGIFAGRVLASTDGKMLHMVERRSGQKFQRHEWINAGLLIVSPAALRFIPRNQKYDFSKQLIPQLLKQKKDVHIFQGASFVLASDTQKSYRMTQRIVKRYNIQLCQ